MPAARADSQAVVLGPLPSASATWTQVRKLTKLPLGQLTQERGGRITDKSKNASIYPFLNRISPLITFIPNNHHAFTAMPGLILLYS